jgi:hypothetical protein
LPGRKEIKRKMERLDGSDYLMFAYHHAIIIILQQLLSSIDLKKTLNHL